MTLKEGCFAAMVVLAVAGISRDGNSQTSQDPLPQIIARLEASHKNLKDFQARVRQKKFFADLGDEVTFEGTVAYARPERMFWNFTSPDPSSLLIRPDGLWLYVPAMKQIQKFGRKSIDAYFVGFEKSLAEMKDRYQMEFVGRQKLEQGQADLIKLARPNDAYAAEIWIWFDVSSGIPLRIRWKGAQGEVTTTDFFDAKSNQGVDEHLFDVKVPPGYELIASEDL